MKLIVGVAVTLVVYLSLKWLGLGPWLVDARVLGAIALGVYAAKRTR